MSNKRTILYFRCLTSDKGDVAFLPLPALIEIGKFLQQFILYLILILFLLKLSLITFVDKKNETEGGVKTSDFLLVCPDGDLAPVEEWSRCNLGLEPPHIIVSSAGKSVHSLEELKHGILAASTIYSKKPDLLRLFGSWGGHANVLFKVNRNDIFTYVLTDRKTCQCITIEQFFRRSGRCNKSYLSRQFMDPMEHVGYDKSGL